MKLTTGQLMSYAMQRMTLVTTLLSLVIPALGQNDASQYELVILDGRVMDPESGLDAVRHLGIGAGKIQVLSTDPLRGRTVIDARGLVVAPGFIDLHQHSHNQEADRAKVLDGVTTALDMEGGAGDIDRWYAERSGKALVNYGAAVSHSRLRSLVVSGGRPQFPTGEAATRNLSAAELEKLKTLVDQGMRRGAPGVGISLGDTPGATPWETLEIFRLAAKYPGAPVHMHVRASKEEAEYWLETEEVLAAALISRAPLQIVHANSSYSSDVGRLFDIIAAARQRGLDVTTECYPYTAGMHPIEAALYEDWRSWADSQFERYEWPATGERLTRQSFERYRQEGGLVVIHGVPEDAVRQAVASPLTMIASDGILENGVAHPRNAGTYARVLGRYVRQEGLLSLMDALRKMTLMPAQRLEGRVPPMKDKGRVRVGADADITVFDPGRIIDRATYREPSAPSAGIQFVLVNGVVVVANGRIHDGVAPGRPIRAPMTN
jgi:N-acyl-D-aspartate/D-glutamate deacylase